MDGVGGLDLGIRVGQQPESALLLDEALQSSAEASVVPGDVGESVADRSLGATLTVRRFRGFFSGPETLLPTRPEEQAGGMLGGSLTGSTVGSQ